jgi:signal transduction histidine kinase
VEVHANLLQNMIAGHLVRSATWVLQVLLLIAFSLLSTWLVLRWPGWKSFWIPLFLLVVVYLGGFWLFNSRGMLLQFGPLVCAATLATPLAQLENLSILNRGLDRGLRQLRSTLSGTEHNLADKESDPIEGGDLQAKVSLVHQLQIELASLYTFRQHLLESMREGLAVFSGSGEIEFHNPSWDRFCDTQNWNPNISLVEFGRLLGHPAWCDLDSSLKQGALLPESDVYLGGGFWQVRGLNLSSQEEAGQTAQWMIVVTDMTSHLERDQARAEALRFVTHELRTPLVSIQGFAEFLLRNPDAQHTEEASATIFRESQRLVSLINTYLDVLRFDAGARALRREPIVVPEMVAQVQKVISPIAEAADIRVDIDLAPQLPTLTGDSPMLTGVLLNLLNNAVKYSPEGSVVSLHVWREGDSVRFEVCNPGEPIPSDQLAHLFEPFYRVREHATSAPGWGLGLSFVKRIVEEHRGTIEASSDANGIRVRVSLSVSTTQRPSRAAAGGSV